MEKNMIIAMVLGILVVISIVQAVQLFGVKDMVASGALSQSQSAAVAQGSPSGDGRAQALPSNIQNLPSMVGGC